MIGQGKSRSGGAYSFGGRHRRFVLRGAPMVLADLGAPSRFVQRRRLSGEAHPHPTATLSMGRALARATGTNKAAADVSQKDESCRRRFMTRRGMDTRALRRSEDVGALSAGWLHQTPWPASSRVVINKARGGRAPRRFRTFGGETPPRWPRRQGPAISSAGGQESGGSASP